MLQPSAEADADIQIHTCEQTIGHLKLSFRVLWYQDSLRRNRFFSSDKGFT